MNIEQMYKNAYERNRREAAEGITPSAISALRVQAEFDMLFERQGLTRKEAHAKLLEYLASKNMTLDDFKRRPCNENLDMVREAFAD